MDAALVELQADRAVDLGLAMVDRRLQHLPLGREPKAVVDQLRIARHKLLLEMRSAAVERQLLDRPMGGMVDGAARRLVQSAALHPDEAVLDQVQAADPMTLAELVELGQ